jgi:hypothetical protein
MGGCQSTPDKAERERSEAIDRQIEEDSRQFKKECKILLLGLCPLAVCALPTIPVATPAIGKKTLDDFS